jgi:flagellar biosynthetic protein FliR
MDVASEFGHIPGHVGGEISGLIDTWPQYLAAALLVLMRLSAIVAFAPLFSSAAIAPRIKAGFVIAMTVLLAPAVAAIPGARPATDAAGILGELGVGLIFGLSLALMNEALQFAGTMLGVQFSFSLVNLLDPNSSIETPVLGQMLGWLGLLVIIGAGLDRTLLAAVVRSFCMVPVGTAVVHAKTGAALAQMVAGVFLAGLQLASPVIAAAMAVEVTISLVSRLAPSLPAMIVSIPLKTLVSYVVLIASLAVWPGWIEQHWLALLEAAGRMVGAA